MSSRVITWGIVGVLAAAFIYWQYSNYAHNNQLNTNLGNRNSIEARAAAARELIQKKQFGDVLPTTPEYVHYRVIDGLSKLTTDRDKDVSTEALNQLVSLLKDSDEGVRGKAQRYLVALGTAAIPGNNKGVVTALGDADPHAKKGAIAVLDQIGAPAIPVLVDAVENQAPQRAAAIDALVALAPTPNTSMLKLLSHKDKDVRSAAATYFGNSRQKAGENQLLTLLKDKDVRPAAIRAEGLLGDVRALPEIEKALSAPADQGNRRTAIVALGDMRATSAIPLIIPFLRNQDADTRSVAVVALRSMGTAGVPAITLAYRSGDPVTRKGVAGALQGITSPEAISLLTSALHDPDMAVRHAAAESLGVPKNGMAVPPLIGALADPSPDVAEAAETSLARIGAPAIGPLVAALSTPVSSIAAAATPGTTMTGTTMTGGVATGGGATTGLTATTAPGASAAGRPKAGAPGSPNVGSPAPIAVPIPPAAPAPAAGSPAPAATAGIVAPYYASRALVLIGSEVTDAVIAAAQKGSITSRQWALVTLGDLRTPRAAPVLRSIAESGDPALRWFAQDALRHYQA